MTMFVTEKGLDIIKELKNEINLKKLPKIKSNANFKINTNIFNKKKLEKNKISLKDKINVNKLKKINFLYNKYEDKYQKKLENYRRSYKEKIETVEKDAHILNKEFQEIHKIYKNIECLIPKKRFFVEIQNPKNYRNFHLQIKNYKRNKQRRDLYMSQIKIK